MFHFDPHLASTDQSPATCRTKTVGAVIATRGLDRRGSNPGPLSARPVEIYFVAQSAPRNDSANLIEICPSWWEASRSGPVPPAPRLFSVNLQHTASRSLPLRGLCGRGSRAAAWRGYRPSPGKPLPAPPVLSGRDQASATSNEISHRTRVP